MKSTVVYCGASFGSDENFKIQAELVGRTLAKQNIQLIYGGAVTGLMGAVANGALEEKGQVIGVLPHFLKTREIAHERLTDLIFVETMHERKTKMNDLCDSIIVLPGGFGTLEEFFEMITWSTLGLHKKPIGILNVDGFYDELISFIKTMVNKGFVKEINQDLILISNSIDDLLDKMRNYESPVLDKVITKKQL